MTTPTATARVSWQWLLLLGLVAALGPLSSDAYLPAFPTMRADFHTSGAAIQGTLTAMLIGAAIGPIVMGPLSDVIGRRWPFIGSLLAFSIVSFAQAFAPTIGLLIALRLVQGFCGMSASVLSQAMLRDMTPPGDLLRALSRMRLVSLSAPIIAPTLGVLALQYTGWRGIFHVTGSAALVLSLVLLRTPADAFRGRAENTDRVVRRSFESYRFLLHDPRVLLGNIAAASMFSALLLYISNGPLVFRDAFAVEPHAFGLIFTVNALCMLTGSQLAPVLVARLGGHRLFVGATAVSAVALTFMFAAAVIGGRAAPLFFVALAVVVGAFGVSLILPTKELMELHPDRAGAGAALLRSTNMVTAGVAGLLLGLAPSDSALPMVVGMVLFDVVALLSWWRRSRIVA